MRIKINSKYHKELGQKIEACTRSVVISKGMFSLVKIRKERKHRECKLLEFILRYPKYTLSALQLKGAAQILL